MLFRRKVGAWDLNMVLGHRSYVVYANGSSWSDSGSISWDGVMRWDNPERTPVTIRDAAYQMAAKASRPIGWVSDEPWVISKPAGAWSRPEDVLQHFGGALTLPQYAALETLVQHCAETRAAVVEHHHGHHRYLASFYGCPPNLPIEPLRELISELTPEATRLAYEAP